MYGNLVFLVSSIVIHSDASTIDVDKLFHANPPSLSPNGLANVPKPVQHYINDPSNSVITEMFDDDFNPYRGSRHDEFDWVSFAHKIIIGKHSKMCEYWNRDNKKYPENF